MSDNNMKITETIRIIIDNEMVNKYNEIYFDKHPRRKKPPIDKCIPPSLNIWGNMTRNQKNKLKQDWNDFGEWVVEQNGLSNKGIERCRMSWNYYFPTKHRRDCSNTTPKQIEDSLVSSGLLLDDNYTIVNPLILQIFYCKEYPRTEIVIEVLEEEK